MNYLSLFKMPKPVKITGRSSSITNSFINSIIPVIEPTNDEIVTVLEILGMEYDSFQCSYCGSTATEWDHLRPLVINKRPTGFISEIQNLLPSCGKCNQSKGNKSWDSWIVGSAALSPYSKGVKNLGVRIKRIQEFEKWRKPTIVDFESLVGTEKWNQHWDNCETVQGFMRHAQSLAEEIKKTVSDNYKKQ